MKKSRWYMAVLVIASRIEEEPFREPSVDLQYRLVQAPDHESAFDRAQEIGGDESHAYKNVYEQTVCWEFLGLHDLRLIDAEEFVDGLEIYSRMTKEEDPADLVCEKERLSCFWYEANKHRTAEDILGDSEGDLEP